MGKLSTLSKIPSNSSTALHQCHCWAELARPSTQPPCTFQHMTALLHAHALCFVKKKKYIPLGEGKTATYIPSPPLSIAYVGMVIAKVID